MSEHKEKIYDLIHGKIKEIFKELNPRPVGENFYLICPKCKKPDAFIGRALPVIKCNHRTNCGYKADFWKFFQEEYKLTPGEALRKMAEAVGYSLPELKPQEREAIEKKRVEAEIKERVFNKFRLWFELEPEADSVKEYLKGRGWTPGEIDGENCITDIGYFSKRLLESGTQAGTISGPVLECIKKIRPSSWPDAYALVIPWRGPGGDIETFQFRAIDDRKDDKYLFAPGTEKGKILFNFNEAKRARTDELYIVEGTIDALRLTFAGLKNVVALGGCVVNDEHIKLLKAAKFKHVISTLDLDKAGEDGMEKAIKLLNQYGLKSYAVDLPAGVKDPDEFLRQNHTIAEFKALDRITGIVWYAKKEFEKAGNDAPGRAKALENTLKLFNEAGGPIDKKNVMNLLALNGFDPEDIKQKITEIETEKRGRETRSEAANLVKQMEKDISGGKNIEEIFKKAKDAHQAIRLKNFENRFKAYTLEDFDADLKNIPESLTLDAHRWGNVLSENVEIQPGSVNIVAARTGTGKTTFMINLTAYFANKYKEKTFIFINYEEMPRDVAWRFISVLTGPRKEMKTRKEYVAALKAGRSTAAIELGRQKFDTLTKQNSLLIDCQCFGITDLCNHISYYCENYNIGAIFVDYIQRVKNDNRDVNTPTRQLEIQYVSGELVQIAREKAIPIILGAQVTRSKDTKKEEAPTLERIRESGDIEQDANTVLCLHVKSEDKDQKPITGNIVTLEVHIEKNRNGERGNCGELNWHKSEYYIESGKPNEFDTGRTGKRF